MDPLQETEAVQQFMKLLEDNGRQGQAADLSALVWYMDGMNRQYEAILAELQALKEQLAQEKRPSVKNAARNAAEKLEHKAHQIKDMLDNLWEKITQCAANAVRDFKELGVSALDKAVSALGVKKALEAIQEGVSGLAADARNHIEKVEDMGLNLRSAGAHLKNAGRAMLGKEAQAVSGGQISVRCAGPHAYHPAAADRHEQRHPRRHRQHGASGAGSVGGAHGADGAGNGQETLYPAGSGGEAGGDQRRRFRARPRP